MNTDKKDINTFRLCARIKTNELSILSFFACLAGENKLRYASLNHLEHHIIFPCVLPFDVVI